MWSPVPPDLAAASCVAADRLGLFANRLHFLNETTSTNDVLARLADAGAPEGTVVVADAQTAGRGRRGRVWVSPPGAGLYVSVLLRPHEWAGLPPSREASAFAEATADRRSLGGGWSADRRSLAGGGQAREPVRWVTLMAGTALATAVRAATGLAVQLKWPNDLVVPDERPMARVRARKLGGILTEASAVGADVQHVVIGCGINLRDASYPTEVSERATSLERELGRPIDRGAVLVESLAKLAAGRDDLVAGRFDAMLAAWRALAPSAHDVAVEWHDGDRHLRGVTAGIDDDGFLRLRVGDRLERVVSGEIEWL